MNLITPQQALKLQRALDVCSKKYNFFAWSSFPGRMPICIFTTRRSHKAVIVDATGKRYHRPDYSVDWSVITPAPKHISWPSHREALADLAEADYE